MDDSALSVPPACLTDPYALEDWAGGFPEAERGAVARGVAASLGHGSLERWKEHHAFGIALGRPLDEFPRGTYAFYFHGDEPLPGREVLPEELEEPDLTILGEAAGLDEAEMEAMDDEALSDAIAGQLGEQILDEDCDGFFKYAEAPSLFELLRIMVRDGQLGIDPEASATDAMWRDERLGAEHVNLRPIRDLRLRRIAAELDGDEWQMSRTEEDDSAGHCEGVLLRRPGWIFVLGWDGLPPVDMGGACILCLPEEEDEDAEDEEEDAEEKD